MGIIELLDQHTTTQQIAQTLVVSPTTVYSHIKSVLRKLGVHTRHDAITAAHHLRHQEVQSTKTPTPTQ
jgi:DNA-binding CsgD family transcriptional regulator